MSGMSSQEQGSEKKLSAEQATAVETVMRSQSISMEELASWAISNTCSNKGIAPASLVPTRLVLVDKELENRQRTSLTHYIKKISQCCLDFTGHQKGGIADLTKAVEFYRQYAVHDENRRTANDKKEELQYDLQTGNDKGNLEKEIEAQKIIFQEKDKIIKDLMQKNEILNPCISKDPQTLKMWIDYLKGCLTNAQARRRIMFNPNWVIHMETRIPLLINQGDFALTKLDENSSDAKLKNGQRVFDQHGLVTKRIREAYEMGTRQSSRVPSASQSRAGGDYDFSEAPSRPGAGSKNPSVNDKKSFKKLSEVFKTFFSLKKIEILDELTSALDVSAVKLLPLISPATTNSFFSAPSNSSSELIQDEKERNLIMNVMGDLIVEDKDKDSVAITKCLTALSQDFSQSTAAFKALERRLKQCELNKNTENANETEVSPGPFFLTEEEIKGLKPETSEDLEKIKICYNKVKFIYGLIGEQALCRYLPIYDRKSKLAVQMKLLIVAFQSQKSECKTLSNVRR